jgi:hypothetical protein
VISSIRNPPAAQSSQVVPQANVSQRHGRHKSRAPASAGNPDRKGPFGSALG